MTVKNRYLIGQEVGINGIVYINDIEPVTEKNGKKFRRCLFKCHCGRFFENHIIRINRNYSTSCGCNTFTAIKKIPLTQGYEAIVDNSDYIYLSQFKWSVVKSGKIKYAQRATFNKEKNRWQPLLMHSDLLKTPSGVGVDHRDMNGLNNRRNNLRFADKSLNGINRPSKNGYKGVSSHRNGIYRARIFVKGKEVSLGSFISEKGAAEAYNLAAVKYFGEFAFLNKL